MKDRQEEVATATKEVPKPVARVMPQGVAQMLSLQRSAGNAAVTQMLLRNKEGAVATATAPPFDPVAEVEKQLAKGFSIEDLAWAAFQVDTDLEAHQPFLDFLHPWLARGQTALARREYDRVQDFGQAAAAMEAISGMQQQAEDRVRVQAAQERATPDEGQQALEAQVAQAEREANDEKQAQAKKARKGGGRARGRGGGGGKKVSSPKADAHGEAAQRLETYKQELEQRRTASEESAVEQARADVGAFTEQGAAAENQRLLSIANLDTKVAEVLRGPAAVAGQDEAAEAMLKQLATEPNVRALAAYVTDLVGSGVSAANAIPAARLLAKAPEARTWLIANGSLDPAALEMQIQLLGRFPKAVPQLTKALGALGFDLTETYAKALAVPAVGDLVMDPARIPPELRVRVLQAAAKAADEIEFLAQAFEQESAAGKQGLPQEKVLELIGRFKPKKVLDARRAMLAGQVPAKAEAEFIESLGMMSVDDAVVSANQEPIELPKGVEAQGWIVVGKTKYPMAFRTGSYETDAACLKHYEEWGGDNKKFAPDAKTSKTKMQNYFADMVAACNLAVADWKQEKKPDIHKASVRTDKTHWRINVKKAGEKPQVFHVDSHYETSYWRTHDA